jgi:hypothetical protein
MQLGVPLVARRAKWATPTIRFKPTTLGMKVGLWWSPSVALRLASCDKSDLRLQFGGFKLEQFGLY